MPEPSVPSGGFARMDVLPIGTLGNPVRPDLTPAREPQTISRDQGTRVNQLLSIASEPSAAQVTQLAKSIKEAGTGNLNDQDAETAAKNKFARLGPAVEKMRAAERVVEDMYHTAKTPAWKEKFPQAQESREKARAEAGRLVDELASAGIMVEPQQQGPTSQGEIASRRRAEFGWETARRILGFKKAAGEVVGRVSEKLPDMPKIPKFEVNVSARDIGDKLAAETTSGWEAFKAWWSTSKTVDVATATVMAGAAGVDATSKYTVEPAWGGLKWAGSSVSQAGRWISENGGRLKVALSQDEEGRSVFKRTAVGATERAQSVWKNATERLSKVWENNLAGPIVAAIDKERPWVRDQMTGLQGQMAVLADRLNENPKISPFYRRAVDGLAWARNKAGGLMPEQLKGIQLFARRSEKPQGVVQTAVAENAWSLRAAASGARDRLNSFMAGAGAAKDRVFGELKIPVVMNTPEPEPYKGYDWQAEKVAFDKEFAQVWSKFRARISLEALGKWFSEGKTATQVSRLQKIFRGLGAASVTGAARLGAAGAEVVGTRGGRIALGGVAAAGVGVLAANVGFHFNPNIFHGIGDLAARGANMAQGIDLTGLQEHLRFLTERGNDVVQALPNLGGLAEAAQAAPDAVQGVVAGASPDVVQAQTVVEAVSSLPPGVEQAMTLLDLKRPLESQAAELAGGRTGEYFDIIKEGVFRNASYYLGEAQALLNSPDPATRTIAQQQISAIQTLQANPNLDPESSTTAYQLFMRAASLVR